MTVNPQQIYRPQPAERSVKTRYLLVLAAAACLYGATVQRGVCWQDSGMHQWRALGFELNNPLGLALAHPLWIVLAQPCRLAGANFAVATNLLSGLAMAITVANVFLLGYWLTGNSPAATLAAAMLAVAHTPWWLATVAESYPWVTAGLTTEMLLLLLLIARPGPRTLALLALVSGLGFSMHNFALLPLPVYAVTAVLLVFRKRLPWWALALALAAWLVGAALQMGLIVQAGLDSGDWAGAIRSALFGSSWQQDVLSIGGGDGGLLGIPIIRGLMYLLLNWPFVSLVPVIYGWWAMADHAGRASGLALGAIAAIELLFGIRYPVPDQFMFLLLAYTLLAVGAAVGIARIMALPPRKRKPLMAAILASIILTPALYGVLPWALERGGRSIRSGREVPFRNENYYWLSPWKLGEGSAERFSIEALGAVEPDSVILAGPTEAYPLLLQQELREIRPGATVMHPFARSWGVYAEDRNEYRRWLGDRPMYIVASRPLPTPPSLESHVRIGPGRAVRPVRWQNAASASRSAE